jgi:hypothetical protein
MYKVQDEVSNKNEILPHLSAVKRGFIWNIEKNA